MLLCSALATLFVTTTMHAQTRSIAERLGHPRDAKLLILHADDLGVAHSENAASFAALDSGGINSASIMMTTPWVTETAEYMKAKPNADLGLHLVMTSEWDTYRWGGVAPNDKTQSLHDPDGTMPRQVRTVMTRAKIDEVERELRAQIDRAYAIGLKPTHVDSHMGALFSTPELFATYVKVARSYKLPFLAFIGAMNPAARSALQPGDIFPDTVFDAGNTPKEQWKQFYLDALKNLKPGLTEILFHLGYDDAELKAVTVNKDAYGSGWRQRDYDVVMSKEWKQALKDNKVVLVTWREIQKAMYAGQ
ncbi:MAG TPA: polysaccharide deacetylase family protein [Gemmatimonadaceae bacterium]|nr:polysaccharide deacetylase family protein [Gemmatimonadaceae bacterium]